MIGRILMAGTLLVVMSAAPVLFQTKCYIVQGKMVCCDNYGLCN